MVKKLRKKKSVALKYDEKTANAPVVVAKGEGKIAEEILKKASENEIPIYEDGALVEVLSEIEIDREIPTELYKAVAEILSWVYRAHKSIN
ncbi:MAG: EscU/YscU/HrcU family type III secretion system export apparatus switch protein [Chitinispirillales bacterium]|jgi:flagellar biosynthesis protein|nr:EscU/YscU/HrcU family type III secretion system export apparatus switch protein [Chitinispirillales bacterium]